MLFVKFLNFNISMLVEFIYTSTATAPLQWTDLEVLRHECARRNQLEKITGMLLYDGNHFMQVLEGEEKKIFAFMFSPPGYNIDTMDSIIRELNEYFVPFVGADPDDFAAGR